MTRNLWMTGIFSTWALAACTHTTDVRTPQPRSEDEFVTTRDGGRYEARARGDGWVTSTGVFLRPDQVETTEGRHHGRGALDGLAIGAAAGTGIGVILGAIADRGCEFLCVAVPALGILGSMAGGLTGVVIGSAVGSNDVQQRAAPRLRVVPTASGASAHVSWKF